MLKIECLQRIVVPRKIRWWILEKKQVLGSYNEIIKDMYHGVTSTMGSFGGDTIPFSITLRTHQGLTLSALDIKCLLVLCELLMDLLGIFMMKFYSVCCLLTILY